MMIDGVDDLGLRHIINRMCGGNFRMICGGNFDIKKSLALCLKNNYPYAAKSLIKGMTNANIFNLVRYIIEHYPEDILDWSNEPEVLEKTE
jgi:hypothetical protein